MERGPAREAAAAGQSAQTQRHDAGRPLDPYPEGCRAEEYGVAGSGVPPLFHAARRRSVRRGRMGAPRGASSATRRGEVVFEQRDVEIPKSWSQQATNIVVSKYFRGQIGTPERERSVKQLIGRVVDTITEWARRTEYFASDERSAGVQRRSEAHPRLPEGGVQQPGLVQLRLREGAAVLGLLHQLGRRTRWTRS